MKDPWSKIGVPWPAKVNAWTHMAQLIAERAFEAKYLQHNLTETKNEYPLVVLFFDEEFKSGIEKFSWLQKKN